MNQKAKRFLCSVLAAAMMVLLVGCGMEHIEDTNGADDYSLTTITDENIINLDLGSVGGPNEQTGVFSDTVTYSAKKFTGVADIYSANVMTNYLEITVNHAAVTAGNFRLVLVVNGEIVHEFTLNELTQTYGLEDVSGTVSLRIAGESAAFMFDYTIL